MARGSSPANLTVLFPCDPFESDIHEDRSRGPRVQQRPAPHTQVRAEGIPAGVDRKSSEELRAHHSSREYSQ